MTSPFDTTVVLTGPLFNHDADRAVVAFLVEAQCRVAEQGLANWQQNMDAAFKHPTPYYETQAIVQHLGHDEVVHDRGIIYGPWLEGTSTRNRTTRFKGYASLRRAVQTLRPRVLTLCEWTLRRGFLQRMGGG